MILLREIQLTLPTTVVEAAAFSSCPQLQVQLRFLRCGRCDRIANIDLELRVLRCPYFRSQNSMSETLTPGCMVC